MKERHRRLSQARQLDPDLDPNPDFNRADHDPEAGPDADFDLDVGRDQDYNHHPESAMPQLPRPFLSPLSTPLLYLRSNSDGCSDSAKEIDSKLPMPLSTEAGAGTGTEGITSPLLSTTGGDSGDEDAGEISEANVDVGAGPIGNASDRNVAANRFGTSRTQGAAACDSNDDGDVVKRLFIKKNIQNGDGRRKINLAYLLTYTLQVIVHARYAHTHAHAYAYAHDTIYARTRTNRTRIPWT